MQLYTQKQVEELIERITQDWQEDFEAEVPQGAAHPDMYKPEYQGIGKIVCPDLDKLPLKGSEPYSTCRQVYLYVESVIYTKGNLIDTDPEVIPNPFKRVLFKWTKGNFRKNRWMTHLHKYIP